jgi:hypothetical protein
VQTIELKSGNMIITRTYPDDDLIWGLPQEKRERKAIADCRRDLAVMADELSHEQVVVRG